MTFEQLEYLIAAAEHPTFFDAAESLHITQSTLSKQIMKLERELGVSLFDRSRRNASLTAAGSVFCQDARKLLAQYRKSLANLRQFQESAQKEIRIGTLPILNQYHLTTRFNTFAKQHPEYTLILDEVEEQELLSGFEADSYDLIVARSSMTDPNRHISWLLTEDELVAVLPAGHRLADAGSLTLADLAEERFLLMNRYTSIYQLCMDCFRQSGITPRVLRTGRVESIISAVAVGEGISLLPKGNFEVFHHDHVIPVPFRPSITLPVVLVRKKAKSAAPAVKELIQFLNHSIPSPRQ